MDFSRHIELDATYDEAVAWTRDALGDQGFGILTEIDMRQTLKDKLDVDIEPQVILGACNPQLAHRALEADPRIASLLPCNVVVRVVDGHTHIDALDPKLIADIPDNPDLEPIATEAGERIQAALDALSQRST
ncbi:DUF302 domain-containing protein [soil metagenome]